MYIWCHDTLRGNIERPLPTSTHCVCLKYEEQSGRSVQSPSDPGCVSGLWFPHLVHHLLGLPEADAEAAGLVVQAVGARHQLPEGGRARKPGLQVQLLTGCVVQGTWNAHAHTHTLHYSSGLVVP